MSLTATCSSICRATGTGYFITCPGPSPETETPAWQGLRPVRTPARTIPVTRVRLPGSESPRAGGGCPPPPSPSLPGGFRLKMISSPRREQTVSVHALPGATSFAACVQLFRRYPLAVTEHCADGEYRSMVLMNHAAEPAGRTCFRHHLPGGHRQHAGPSRRRAARLGNRQPGNRTAGGALQAASNLG